MLLSSIETITPPGSIVKSLLAYFPEYPVGTNSSQYFATLYKFHLSKKCSRYGIGKYGFREHFLDKWNLYSVAKYCDEFVPTGYSGKYANNDFTIDPGGVIVSIDDSSTALGEEVFMNRFPEGGEQYVCLKLKIHLVRI